MARKARILTEEELREAIYKAVLPTLGKEEVVEFEKHHKEQIERIRQWNAHHPEQVQERQPATKKTGKNREEHPQTSPYPELLKDHIGKTFLFHTMSLIERRMVEQLFP